MRATVPGPDGMPRCGWCQQIEEFFPYHDTEWGFPVKDDRRLFEKLCLEGFQAGLSWRTILAKRESFREAFLGFDYDRLAEYTPAHVEQLMANKAIIRHRGKIEAVINNARCAQDLIKREGSLAAFFWRYEPLSGPDLSAPARSTSPESERLSRDLKKMGWKFVGPTTMYAFMQAMGLVNDHAKDCVVRERVAVARSAFAI